MSGSSLTREGTQMTKFIEFKKKVNLARHFAFSSSFAIYLLYTLLLIEAFDD